MTHRAWPMTLAPVPVPSIGWYQNRDSQSGVLEHANTGSWGADVGSTPSLLFGAVVGWSAGIDVTFVFAWAPLVIGGASPVTTSFASDGYFTVTLPAPYVASEGMLTVVANVDNVLSDQIILSVAAGGYGYVGNYANYAWGPEP